MVGHFRGKLQRVTPCRARCLGHFQAVFVGAGHQPHVAAQHPLETGDGIGSNRLVGMADMRLAIGVGDGGGQIELFGHMARVHFHR